MVGIAVHAPMDTSAAGKVAPAGERVGCTVVDMPLGAGHRPVEVSAENTVGAVGPAAAAG